MAVSLATSDAHQPLANDCVDRLRAAMSAEDIDVLVLTDTTNIEYFFGYSTLTWQYKARPIFGIISHDRMELLAAHTEQRNIEQVARPFGSAYYDGYLEEACALAHDRISAQNIQANGIAAIDYGQDFFGFGSLELLDVLRSLFRDGRVVSGGTVIWQVRRVKSEVEAERKRDAFSIVNRAFDNVIANTCLGISETDLYRRLQSEFFLEGAETAPRIAMTFGRGDFVYNRPPGRRRLAEGDYLWTDFRATVGGFPADRNRIARGGEPEPWERDTYKKVRDVTIGIASGIRAGQLTGDVFERFLALWGEYDLPAPYKNLKRIGHGGGRDVTEPPSLSRGGTELIEAGMILHIEPKLEMQGAVFQFEEVVFVTDTGVEFLSEFSPKELPVIRAD
ncbi:M24 family metallopeptidase [Pelagibius sp.]|uniref:M24 family metallopeptidase n=1 Tax=Pelagibius sp. TaxID=1931238 RepID=UPI003BB1BFDB